MSGPLDAQEQQFTIFFLHNSVNVVSKYLSLRCTYLTLAFPRSNLIIQLSDFVFVFSVHIKNFISFCDARWKAVTKGGIYYATRNASSTITVSL